MEHVLLMHLDLFADNTKRVTIITKQKYNHLLIFPKVTMKITVHSIMIKLGTPEIFLLTAGRVSSE